MKNLKMIAAFVALSMAFSCQNETTENLSVENNEISAKEKLVKKKLNNSNEIHSKVSCNPPSFRIYRDNGVRFDFNNGSLDHDQFAFGPYATFVETLALTYETTVNTDYLRKVLKSNFSNLRVKEGIYDGVDYLIDEVLYSKSNLPIITFVDMPYGIIEYRSIKDCEDRIYVDKTFAQNLSWIDYDKNEHFSDSFRFVLAYAVIKDLFIPPYEGDFVLTPFGDDQGNEVYYQNTGKNLFVFTTEENW